MKRLILAVLLCTLAQPAAAVDTDGDGLLDLIDVPGFAPNATGNVEFVRRGIQDLDGANLLTRASSLYLNANQITSIENGDFYGLDNLFQLELRENQLASIDSGDFEGLSRLDSLDLSINRITNIESGAFQGLSNLLGPLNLGNNQITTIETGAFQGLSNLHFGLYLDNNQITSIELGVFDGLRDLYSLSLRANQITRIESGAFDGLDILGEIALSSNRITHIESGAWQGLEFLSGLWLDHNQITSIESGDFDGLDKLGWLDLRGNQITSFESGAFYGFSRCDTLYLEDNALTELNFSEAHFESLRPWDPRGGGFGIDAEAIARLILDRAEVSQGSFAAIVGETTSITDVSLVGLTFTDGNPGSLSSLLNISSLDKVTVDAALFVLYADEFEAFDGLPGNTVTVVLSGDTNGDGSVDLNDLNNVRNNFGLTGDDLLGDTNGDDVVDMIDLNNVRNYFGLTSPRSVPEPATIIIVGVAIILCSERARRIACATRKGRAS